MTSIEEDDQQRWEFLRRLYEATDGTPKFRSESQGIIGETMGLDAQTCDQIVHWLIEHNYAEPHGMSEDVEITTLGVDKVESELRAEHEITEPDALTPLQARELEAFLTQLRLAQAHGHMELSPTDAAGMRSCHVLYVGNAEHGRIETILRIVQGSPVLTVSDGREFAQYGGIIAFEVQDKTVRFTANTRSASNSGISLGSDVLRLAREVVSR